MANKYDLYNKTSPYIIGFHGCDEAVAKELLSTGNPTFKMSTNEYDWLGSGMYFWENNPLRAESFIREVQKRNPKKIKNPTIIGAVLDLGNCLNLLEERYINLVQQSYRDLSEASMELKLPLPINKPAHPNDHDYLLRNLDCAVVEFLHSSRKLTGDDDEFDSVRGVFIEGQNVYPNAGFHEKTHIQIAIRKKELIRGYFRPISYT